MGFRHQRELNKDAQKKLKQSKTLHSSIRQLIKYMHLGAVEINLSGQLYFTFLKNHKMLLLLKQEKAKENYMSFLRGVIRSTNPEFEQFAHKLRALLTISENRELALWSGGIDPSTFSYDKGRRLWNKQFLIY